MSEDGMDVDAQEEFVDDEAAEREEMIQTKVDVVR